MMLARLAPNGVSFKPLGDVASYSDTRVDAADLNAGSFVGVDNLLPKMAGRIDANYSPNTSRLTAYNVDDVLLGNIRPYLQKIWLADSSGGCSGDVLAIRVRPLCSEVLLPEFLYRVLASDVFFAFNMQNAKGAKMPRGDKLAILRFLVPIPPVEIQHYIVETLRTFSKLEAELEAELEARRLQYSFYREALLNAGEKGYRIAALGDIGEFRRGRRFTKADYVDEGIGCIHYGDIYTRYGTSATETVAHVRAGLARSLRYAKTGDVVIAAVGETVEDVGKAVAWLGEDDVAVHDDCFTFHHDQNPKFIAYCFQTPTFNAEKNKFVARAKVKRLSGESLAKLQIPVPSLEEQAQIVDILDKFDALTNDLTSGLPAEIVARRRQYEHYRDRLMNFEKAA